MAAAVATLAVMAALVLWSRLLRLKRAQFIREYRLPAGLFEKFELRRPGLTLKDKQLAAQALRQFFLAYLQCGRRFVSMPSQVADDLWHEFILYTRHYDGFCRHAFGCFLHHMPAAVLGGEASSNAGLRRVWWQACRQENIDPRKPTRLPLLFALDAKLHAADGYRYALGAMPSGAAGDGSVHYTGDFTKSRSGGCGGGCGSGGADGCGDAGGGCSGGCGGGGCGGGD